MTVNQLSIFIENRSGTLVTVLQVLKQAGIQIIASTIADTADYGIYRIICSKPLHALQELKQAGVAVALSPVYALTLDDRPGCAADVVRLFSEECISLTYIYTFLFKGKGILIFRTDDAEKARQLILDNQLPFIAEEDLEQWV